MIKCPECCIGEIVLEEDVTRWWRIGDSRDDLTKCIEEFYGCGESDRWVCTNYKCDVDLTEEEVSELIEKRKEKNND